MNTSLTTDSSVQVGYLRRLLEEVPLGLIHLQPIRNSADQLNDLQITFINTPAATFIGNQMPDDLFGKRWSTVFTNDIGTEFYKQCAQVIAAKETIQYQHERIIDGLSSCFEITISPCDDGVILTVRNVPGQEKQPDSGTQHQTKLLQSVIDTIQSGIHIIRPVFGPDGQILDFRFTAVNPALASYAGVKPTDLVGSTLSEWFPGYREQGLFELYRRVYLTGDEQRIDLNYTKDGFDIWVDAKISKLENEILITHTDYTALKQAQLEIERRADQLKFVTDSALTAIGLYSIIRDPVTGEIVDLRYELINGRAEQMTQRKAEELVGRTMRQVFPGIEGTGIWVKYKHLAETGEPLRYHNHYNLDGYNLWYEVQGIRQDDLIVLSFLDITELKEAQQFNKKQAEEFRQILDNALTAISHFTTVRDENGRIIDFIYQSFNRTSEQFTGFKAEQIVGKRMLELFPGVRASGVFDRWVKLVDQEELGKTERFQDQYQFDGFDFWFDTQAVKWGDGFIQSYIDITPIKQAELKQQKQAELLNAILDATLAAVACLESVRDEQGRIIDFRIILANQTMCTSVGIPAAEINGKLLCDISPALRHADAFDQYVNVAETGVATSMERPLGDKWYYVSVVKFGDGLVLSAIDITDNHRYSQQIETANAELVKSNENLQAFAYVASHDLQEPLRKIESFGDLLKNQHSSDLNEQGIDLVNRMQSAASRMAILIRDLLSYSRITTQKQPFAPENLNAVVADVLSDLETVIQEKQARIEIDKLPIVLGDVSQLRQLFQNLFSNALKFAKKSEGGSPVTPHIRVTCSQAAKRLLPVSVIRSLSSLDSNRTKEPSQYYVIKISDNGIGFDQQHADRIFGAFQRLHGRQQYPGTGIGLAIVKKVAENHGGVVVAEGQSGEGATFTVYLPVLA